ncbi:ABC transporter substrate-binding protein [Paenibacillus hodogayensis]|uniref:ABC transporter substrate-binding protein n=1 Tax=Paenibacillus hodogayensis TaxID=279208 RepID=A0ABV5W836_9BACL
MIRKNLMWLLSMLVVTSMAVGCSKTEPAGTVNPDAQQPAAEKQPDPVKVSLYIHNNIVDDADLQKYIVEPLQKKLPHITLQVTRSGAGTTIQDVLATGSFPDLIITSNAYMTEFTDVGLQSDIAKEIKSQNVDVSRVEPILLEAMRMNSPSGQLYGLPIRQNLGVMIYNQDVFDKFGVPYPTDGMTFEQVVETAKKLTRIEGNTQYIGFDPGNVPNNVSTSLALPFADPKTHKASFDAIDMGARRRRCGKPKQIRRDEMGSGRQSELQRACRRRA